MSRLALPIPGSAGGSLRSRDRTVPLDFAASASEGPSFLTITDCLKAMPAMEGGRRFIFMEASNQARDYQGEIVLAKALAESADYYRQFGNLDLDHIT